MSDCLWHKKLLRFRHTDTFLDIAWHHNTCTHTQEMPHSFMHLFISCDRQPPLLLPNHSAASQYPIRPPQLRPGTWAPLVTVSQREAGGERRRREETRERERQKDGRIKTERERERETYN